MVKTTYQPEYILISEYIKRKDEERKLADPLAPTLHRGTVQRAIDAGGIVPFIQGKKRLIDWKRYKGYIFPLSVQHA